eukprot:11116393-Alexandrium_andersonii.AAC.1
MTSCCFASQSTRREHNARVDYVYARTRGKFLVRPTPVLMHKTALLMIFRRWMPQMVDLSH